MTNAPETAKEEASEGVDAGFAPGRLIRALGDDVRGFFRGFFTIRDEPRPWGRGVMALLCIGVVLGLWFLVTRGAPEARLVPPTVLETPRTTLASLPSLWQDADGNLTLLRHLMASLSRVLEGFALAMLVGIPLGILCGTFRRIDAFLSPISLFGRNVPIAALLPLTLIWFGIDEAQKVGFIFIACVAFVVFDTTCGIASVGDEYLDTAATLGASRWQKISKVLIPLAAPTIFNSMRLLFGLAFGYIILAEAVNAESGVGKLIMNAQRRGPREHVYLILVMITMVAFLLDRTLFAIQNRLFPYRSERS